MTIRRADRVADQIRSSLARCVLTQLRDPSLGFVTITGVKLSPDLRHANVFVTVMPAELREDSVAALNRARPILRRTLAREAGLRFTPELRFHYDEAFEGGQRVEQILRAIGEETSHPPPPGRERTEDEDD
jgi:ribosome-binding factor A